MKAKGCATIKASCNVHWSESKKIAMAQIAKAASSTVGQLFKKTFEYAEMKPCAGLPRDAIIGAFFRDPVEHFFSAYEEAIYRIVNKARSRAKDDMVPAMIRQDIKGYNDWLKYWEGSKTATETFHDYVLHWHLVERPFDKHLYCQSSRVERLEWIDWVGRVSELTEDWAQFLTFARAQRGGQGSSAIATPQEVPKKRENKWRHIFPAKTPKNVIKKICEHVEQDSRCLGLQSRWC